MSDEENFVEELNQEVATPQIIDEETSNTPEADLNQEILESDVTIDTQEPLAKKNSLSSLIGRSFNKQSTSDIVGVVMIVIFTAFFFAVGFTDWFLI